MSYIGREPQIGNFQMCDAISVVNNQAAYTMQVGGVAVIPGGNFNVIASVNGVVQKAGTSFTISSSTITFSQNLVTGDVIDFILILGSVLDLGVPSDGTVTTGKIADNAVTNAKLANSSITLNGSAVSLGGSATIGGGKIGQVLTTEVTAFSFSTTASSPVAITGLSRAITPSATSSKILVMGKVSFGTTSGTRGFIQLRRGTALIGNSTGSGSRVISIASENLASVDDVGNLNFHYIDSPNTNSEVTYNIYGNANGNSAFKLNRSNNDFNGSQTTRGTSVITAMEVLA